MWPRLFSWWCGRILVEAYNVTVCVLWSSYRVPNGSEYLFSHYLKVICRWRVVGTFKWHWEYTFRSYHMFNFEVMNLAVYPPSGGCQTLSWVGREVNNRLTDGWAFADYFAQSSEVNLSIAQNCPPSKIILSTAKNKTKQNKTL